MITAPPEPEATRDHGLVAKTAATLVMSVVICCVLLQVIDRYALHMSVSWTEELARLGMLWIAGVGGVLALVGRAHFRVGIIIELLPASLRRPAELLVGAFSSAFLAYTAYSGFLYCDNIADSTSPMLNVSYAIPYSIIPVSALIMSVYVARRAWMTFREGAL